jgi:hypothetical protein
LKVGGSKAVSGADMTGSLISLAARIGVPTRQTHPIPDRRVPLRSDAVAN